MSFDLNVPKEANSFSLAKLHQSEKELKQLSKAKYIRFDEKKEKLVETTALRVLIEKFKGLLRLANTTSPTFLADKIYVFLQERTELLTEKNLENINLLCRHAGIFKKNQKLTKIQKQLKIFVNEKFKNFDLENKETLSDQTFTQNTPSKHLVIENIRASTIATTRLSHPPKNSIHLV